MFVYHPYYQQDNKICSNNKTEFDTYVTITYLATNLHNNICLNYFLLRFCWCVLVCSHNLVFHCTWILHKPNYASTPNTPTALRRK